MKKQVAFFLVIVFVCALLLPAVAVLFSGIDNNATPRVKDPSQGTPVGRNDSDDPGPGTNTGAIRDECRLDDEETLKKQEYLAALEDDPVNLACFLVWVQASLTKPANPETIWSPESINHIVDVLSKEGPLRWAALAYARKLVMGSTIEVVSP